MSTKITSPGGTGKQIRTLWIDRAPEVLVPALSDPAHCVVQGHEAQHVVEGHKAEQVVPFYKVASHAHAIRFESPMR